MQAMNNETTHHPVEPTPELMQYGDSRQVVEIFKQQGDTFNIARLARQHAADPTAIDQGAIVIMTRSNRVGSDGHHLRQRYVMDYEIIGDRQTGAVQELSAAGDISDITIGLNWHSPFGITYPVEWVMRPYTSGVFEDSSITKKPDAPYSPPAEGLAWLEQQGYGRR
jgi:hypothetical protein